MLLRVNRNAVFGGQQNKPYLQATEKGFLGRHVVLMKNATLSGQCYLPCR